MANPHESALHYPLGRHAAGPRHDDRGARRACAGCAWRCPSRWTTSTCGCCATGRTGVEGWTVVDCGIATTPRAPPGSTSSRTNSGPAGAARDRDAHAPRPHRAGALADANAGRTPQRECRLWISGTDWNAGRMASQSTTGFGGDSAARFFAPARPDRPRVAGPGARAQQLLREHGAAGAGALPAPDGRHGAAASAATPGAASPATAMRRSTSRCTARRWAC